MLTFNSVNISSVSIVNINSTWKQIPLSILIVNYVQNTIDSELSIWIVMSSI